MKLRAEEGLGVGLGVKDGLGVSVWLAVVDGLPVSAGLAAVDGLCRGTWGSKWKFQKEWELSAETAESGGHLE